MTVRRLSSITSRRLYLPRTYSSLTACTDCCLGATALLHLLQDDSGGDGDGREDDAAAERCGAKRGRRPAQPHTTHCSLLTARYSRYSLLTTHYSPLATHHLLLTTTYSLLSLLTAAPHSLLGRGPDQQLRGVGPGSGAGLPDQRGTVHLAHYALRTAYYSYSLTTSS